MNASQACADPEIGTIRVHAMPTWSGSCRSWFAWKRSQTTVNPSAFRAIV